MESARPRLSFERSPTRCPFCHDELREEELLAACRGCGARHHAGCWDEAGRCGACGGARALRDEPPPASQGAVQPARVEPVRVIVDPPDPPQAPSARADALVPLQEEARATVAVWSLFFAVSTGVAAVACFLFAVRTLGQDRPAAALLAFMGVVCLLGLSGSLRALRASLTRRDA